MVVCDGSKEEFPATRLAGRRPRKPDRRRSASAQMRPSCPQLICPVLVRKRTLLAISQDRRLRAHLGHWFANALIPKAVEPLPVLVTEMRGKRSFVEQGSA